MRTTIFIALTFYSFTAWCETLGNPNENAAVAPSYRPFSIEDVYGFHWSIAGPKQTDFSAKTKTFGRDINWVIKNAAKIKSLRASGKKIVCYMNWGRLQPGSGAYEGVYSSYRALERSKMCVEPGDKWGEPWINLRSKDQQVKALKAWGEIIRQASSHCDGLEYDNSDVFENIPGKTCGTAEDVIQMLRKTCEMTHSAGMNCILKNTFDQADRLSDLFDGALGEQCFSFGTDNAKFYREAFGKRKPVACVEYQTLDVEGGQGAYNRNFATDCQSARDWGFASLIVDRKQSVQGDPVHQCAFR